jgi:hypothetical protein
MISLGKTVSAQGGAEMTWVIGGAVVVVLAFVLAFRWAWR